MATTAGHEVPDRTVSIGRVLSRAFGTVGANPVATIGIAFLFGAVPQSLYSYALRGVQVELMSKGNTAAFAALTIVGLVVAVTLSAITQGALVRATVAHSEGRESSFGESATAGLAVILPLIAASILSALGIGLGLILLFVPGVILYCMWIVTAPAVVEERRGPIEALRRSARLTSGARWKIFGLLLILILIYWLVMAVVGGVIYSLFGLRGFASPAAAMNPPLTLYVLTALLQTVTVCVWGVVATSLYIELRDWKDGPRAEVLAEVFG